MGPYIYSCDPFSSCLFLPASACLSLAGPSPPCLPCLTGPCVCICGGGLRPNHHPHQGSLITPWAAAEQPQEGGQGGPAPRLQRRPPEQQGGPPPPTHTHQNNKASPSPTHTHALRGPPRQPPPRQGPPPTRAPPPLPPHPSAAALTRPARVSICRPPPGPRAPPARSRSMRGPAGPRPPPASRPRLPAYFKLADGSPRFSGRCGGCSS